MIDLHVHTKYSLLDAIIEPEDLVKKAVEDGKEAVCVTDHGHIYSNVEMYKLCQEYGIKYILGVEAYICNDATIKDPDDRYSHLVILAKNEQGRLNINRLVSESTMYKYYGKPRIDWGMLKKYSEGLIITSACMAGELSRVLLGRKTQEQLLPEDITHDNMSKREMALRIASRYKSVFGDDYYIEVQAHDVEDQLQLNAELADIAKALDIPLVASTDAHYLNEEDQKYHDVWVQIGTTREAGEIYNDCYIMPEDKVRRILGKTLSTDEVNQSIDNTHVIASQCNVEIPLRDPQLPHINIPAPFTDERSYVEYMCAQGWIEKGIMYRTPEVQQRYKERLNYEIDVLEEMGYFGYFIIVRDYKAVAYEVGISRGCTVGETMIFTQNGLKPIKDIKVGELVYTHDGSLQPVTNTMKYDTAQDEKLYKIRTHYSDDIGHAYTDNHKILAIKPERYDMGKRSLQYEPQWYRADEIEVGDMLVVPKFDSYGEYPHQIDLAEYVIRDHVDISQDSIVEYVNTNKPFEFSVRDINRNTSLSRNCIQNILNKGNYRQESEVTMMQYLGDDFQDLDEWREYAMQNRYDTREFNRFIPINEKSLRLLGLMTGDGWVAQNGDTVGLCWHSEEPRASEYIEIMKDVFGQNIDLLTYKTKGKKAVSATFHSEAIKQFFLDFWEGYEYTSSSKNFPDWILSLPDHLKLAFLNGLWEADGSSTKTIVTFSSTSWSLISKVKILLNSLNIPNGLHKRDMKGHKTFSQSWTVSAYNNSSTTSIEIRDDMHLKRVLSIEEVEDDFVYDITVANNHTYVTSSFTAHNSAGGSLVAYLLDITDLDPMVYDLYFERFLDVSALDLLEQGVIQKKDLKIPDIDLDFGDKARDEVMEYVIKEHGRDRVCALGSFQYVWAKGAVRDIGRVLGLPYEVTDEIAKKIDGSMDFKEVMELGVLDAYKDDYPELFDYAERLSGLPKSFSVHPCFTAGHKVLTDVGYKNIEDIVVGDMVMTHKGRFKPVLSVGNEIKDNLIQVSSQNTIIEGTHDHPILIRKPENDNFEWIHLEDVCVGDYVYLPKDKTTQIITDITHVDRADTVYRLTVLDDSSYTVEDIAVHNCGIVISDTNIIESSALDLESDMPTVMLDMDEAEDLGMVKFDFLGLKTVDIIYDTLELIGEDYEYIAPHNIDFNDPKVWAEFKAGHTDLIFQFGSGGMKKTLKGMRAESMDDLIAANALYRPGSMDFIGNYIRRKHGEEEIQYLHPDLEPILKATYGIIVFQEQLIEIGRFAGLRNPDDLRRATGKKDVKAMEKVKPELSNGLKNKGWDDATIEELWNTMLEFANYSSVMATL